MKSHYEVSMGYELFMGKVFPGTFSNGKYSSGDLQSLIILEGGGYAPKLNYNKQLQKIKGNLFKGIDKLAKHAELSQWQSFALELNQTDSAGEVANLCNKMLDYFHSNN